MSQNYFNPNIPYTPQVANPNAVNINIISPQAFANAPCASNAVGNNGYYYNYPQSLAYPLNNNQNAYYYPNNYNNLGMHQGFNPYAMQQMPYYPQQGINQANQTNPLDSSRGLSDNTSLYTKTDNQSSNTNNSVNSANEETSSTKKKKITPLTDDYVKSLENYMNNDNPKVRLIGAKELMERFKEDENRKDSPSLVPLLNKALKDTSAAVRFLALTTLELGYSVGNDETIALLKDIQAKNVDKIGEDSLLASEILLKLSAGPKVEVPMTQAEIEEAKKAAQKKENK